MRTCSAITTSVDRSFSDDTWITRPFDSCGWVMLRKFFTLLYQIRRPYRQPSAKHGQSKGSPVRINLTMNSTARKDLNEKRFAEK